MSCATTSKWIDALLDGELDPKNAAEVEGHLAGCAACRRRYEARRAVSVNVRRLELGFVAPEALRGRIGKMLEAELEAERGAEVERAAVAAASTPRPVTAQGTPQPATPVTFARLEPVPTTSAATLAARAADARAAASSSAPRGSRGPSRWLMLAGWPVALAASALFATVLLQQRSQEADEVVAAHVRSLLADHLNDVVSTSHHTVKPWFAGKIDFSPPVPDLTSLGFELVGGRLDYVDHRQVAAIVYRKHAHIINVLASLPSRDIANVPHTARVQGYSVRSWRQAGLNLVAVSDIDPIELANLEQGFEMPPLPAGEPAAPTP
jgi:anti-sigma factor RsiW